MTDQVLLKQTSFSVHNYLQYRDSCEEYVCLWNRMSIQELGMISELKLESFQCLGDTVWIHERQICFASYKANDAANDGERFF